MDFNKFYKIIMLILLGVIVLLMVYIMPIAYQERDLYKECNIKLLCSMNRIDRKYCSDYNNIENNFTLSLPYNISI